MTGVLAERQALAIVGMRLRRRDDWGSTFNYSNDRAVDEPANHQFVHITVTNPDSYPSNDAHARAIENIGAQRFPNTGLSYNRMILPGGFPYEGQPIGRRGAHTVNDDRRSTCNTSGCPSLGRSLLGSRGGVDEWNLNYNARAYCMARNCGDPVTDADVDAMARCLAADRLAGFVRRDATLHGHRCLSAKSCPCDPTWGLMGQIKARMDIYLAKGNVEEEPMPTAEEIAKAVWEQNIPDRLRVDIPAKPNGEARDAQALIQALRTQTYLQGEEISALKAQVAEIKGNLGSGTGMTPAEIAASLTIVPAEPST